MKEFEFLIIGQGLAGTVLSYSLLKLNKNIFVISDNKLSSSKVAAGMFNFVGGKRMIKTWLAESLLENLEGFYQNFEKFLDTKFYHSQNIVHVFQNNDEKIQTDKRLNEIDYLKYLELNDETYKNINSSFGQINLKNGGWVDTKKMIESFSDYLEKKEIVSFEKFDYSKIVFENNKIIYKDMIFDKIIFCEGYKANENPYFNHIPFQLSKGEVIIIKTDKALEENIFKKGIYIVSLGNNYYKVGATNEWKELNENTTEKSLEYFKEKLHNFFNVRYEIVSQQAGIRPTIIDKKPILGSHTNYGNIYIFNGLGTKGVMLSPYFSQILLDKIFNNIDIPKDVDVRRF